MAYREETGRDPGEGGWARLTRDRIVAIWLVAMLLFAGAFLYAISAETSVELSFGGKVGRRTMPLWLLLAATMGAGVALTAAAASFRRALGTTHYVPAAAGDEDKAAFRRWLLAVLIIGAMLLLLVWGVYARRIDPVAAALVLLCGSATAVTGLFAVESLSRGESPRFESHWGGLGGGTGGWRISPNATLILLALIFLAGAFAAAGLQPEAKGPAAPKAADKAGGAPAAAKAPAAAAAPSQAAAEPPPAADGNVANAAAP